MTGFKEGRDGVENDERISPLTSVCEKNRCYSRWLTV